MFRYQWPRGIGADNTRSGNRTLAWQVEILCTSSASQEDEIAPGLFPWYCQYSICHRRTQLQAAGLASSNPVQITARVTRILGANHGQRFCGAPVYATHPRLSRPLHHGLIHKPAPGNELQLASNISSTSIITSKQTMFRASSIHGQQVYCAESLSSNSHFDGTHHKFILLRASALLANDTRN